MEESIHFAEESVPVGYRISPQTNAFVNDTFLRTLRISYDEYDELDCDEQQKLMREYHKKSPKSRDRDNLVMIGSGEHSCFAETGLTPEEDRIRLDDNLKYSKPIATVRKIVRRIQK